MEQKQKETVAQPQSTTDLHLDLEKFDKQPDQEVMKEQAEDCPDCYYPQPEEEEKKKQATECAQCFYQPESKESAGSKD